MIAILTRSNRTVGKRIGARAYGKHGTKESGVREIYKIRLGATRDVYAVHDDTSAYNVSSYSRVEGDGERPDHRISRSRTSPGVETTGGKIDDVSGFYSVSGTATQRQNESCDEKLLGDHGLAPLFYNSAVSLTKDFYHVTISASDP